MRKPRPAPASDLQSRLRYIEDRARKIQSQAETGEAACPADVAELAYLVSYLAGVVGKHLRDGEN